MPFLSRYARLFQPNGLLGLVLALALSLSYVTWGFPSGFIRGVNSYWLMQTQDISQYVSGFMAFFQEPWQLPLLRIDSLNWPEGTLATFVDAIPLYALLLKALVPDSVGPFNPYGFWIGICLVLQGIGGWWALREAQVNRWSALLGLTALLLTMPVLQHRLGHVSLFSQWILVFALALTLRSERLGQTSAGWCLLMLCGLYINIYLTAMAALLYVTDLWCHRGQPTLRHWLLWPLVTMAIAGITMPVLMWPLPGHHLASDGGFGLYSMNLLAPLTGSRFFSFSNPVVNDAQAVEGFNYLGMGVMAMLGWLWACRRHFAKSNERIQPILADSTPFLVALCIATIYALSNTVTLGSSTLLTWEVPDIAKSITGQFRASGRFFWLVVYTAVIFGVVALSRRMPGWRLSVVLALVVFLQLADRYPAIKTLRGLAAPPTAFTLNLPVWQKALGDSTQTIYFYPKLRCAKNSNLYETLLPVMRYAAEHQIRLSTGYIARYAPECEAMITEARESNPTHSAYVFVNSEYSPDQISAMLPNAPDWHCNIADFATICRTPSRD